MTYWIYYIYNVVNRLKKSITRLQNCNMLKFAFVSLCKISHLKKNELRFKEQLLKVFG